MADDLSTYIDTLSRALDLRRDWLDKTELPKLKEMLRTFQSSFASLYNIFLKKKLINEDPYKQETKISELEVPETGAFNEAKRLEQISIRLSNYDNQLDYLVNFYQIGMEFLNLDRIKRIVGLVRYIDWPALTPDSQSVNTRVVAEMVTQSKAGVDPITLSIIAEGQSRLAKTTASIMSLLKDLSVFYRENYKLKVRQTVTSKMSQGEASTPLNIKKKMASEMPGEPYYQELIDEILKEDYSKAGAEIRENILKSIKVAEEKPKKVKAPVNFKNILLDGIQVIGGSSTALTEIALKFDDNVTVLESYKRGLFQMIKKLIRQITNAEPEEIIYNIEYMDTTKGVPVKEKVNYNQFREDLSKKTRILASFVRGPAYTKLSAMTEEQIIGYLERNIRDVQYIHKTLSALDDYFKANVEQEDRDKIKGVKPELSTIKNSIVKANQLRFEYSAQKEEEEQMQRLGINPSQVTEDPSVPPVGAPPSP